MNHPATDTVRLTADTVLFTQNNPDNRMHVLLVKRRWQPYQDHWALPGGHVDPGETFSAAAHRELAEETGIELPHGTLERVDIYDTPDRDPRGRYVTVAYIAHIHGMPAPAAADDATDARWIPVDEAMADGFPIAFDHKQIIDDALRAAA